MSENVLSSLPRPGKPKPVMWKIVTIVLLILGLLIPLGMISGVVSERQGRNAQVNEEIANTWAGEQLLLGPIMVIPYLTTVDVANDKGQYAKKSVRETLYLLPNRYHVKSQLKPETRYRGIYKSIVYINQLTAEGDFTFDALKSLKIPDQDILWNEAFIATELSQIKGIQDRPTLKLDGKSLEMLPGVNGANLLDSGLYTPFAIDHAQSHSFQLVLNFKGSQDFSMIPIGKENRLQVVSKWPSPSFTGASLPTQRTVNSEGFSATWDIPYFSRSYDQAFTADQVKGLAGSISNSFVGVSLITPVDAYQQAERANKYGILFLVLTFSMYFLFEILAKQRMHAFQYLLVGFSMCLFYLFLIALSEVIGFNGAYALASITTIATITLYSKAIIGKVKRYMHYLIAGLLSLLYGYLYVLLQLEDLSLLLGTIGLFAVLAVVMYVTRNIDWYNNPVA